MNKTRTYHIRSASQRKSWKVVAIAFPVLVVAYILMGVTEVAILGAIAAAWFLFPGAAPAVMEWTITEEAVRLKNIDADSGSSIAWNEITRLKYIAGNSPGRRHGYATLQLTLANDEHHRFHFYDSQEDAPAFVADFLETLNRHNNHFVTE